MIFIQGNVPSSKNSKKIVKSRNGKTFLVNSDTVDKYLKGYEVQWSLYKAEFKKKIKDKEKPLKIGFYFIRDSARKFDYINACQLPCDLMTKHGWIDDDNCDEIIPVFLGHEVDKNNPGVRIEIL